MSRVMGDPASNGTGTYAAAAFMAMTANAVAPVATDTTLTGEVASGTLARTVAIYAHTNGTNTYTLTKSFTSDQTITINKVGIFNAASGGTLLFEILLTTPVTLAIGDQVQITLTVTL